MDKDLKRYLNILKRFERKDFDPTSLDKGDLAFFAAYQPDPETLGAEIDKLGLSPDMVASAIERSKILASTDPSFKEAYVKEAIKQEGAQKARSVRRGIDTALAAGDILTSAKQIRAARRAAERSGRPQLPPTLTEDPLLNQAIADAQQGDFTVARRLAPAQLAVLDQYLSDMNAAKVASTGQAGTYGALSQVASGRRGRGALGLGAMAADIGMQQDRRLDNLTAMKLDQNRAIQQSQAQFYPYQLQQYNIDQNMAADLGSMGRSNLRAAAANFGQNIPDYVANEFMRQRRNRMRVGLPEDQVPLAEAVDAEAMGYDLLNPGATRVDVTPGQMDQMYNWNWNPNLY